MVKIGFPKWGVWLKKTTSLVSDGLWVSDFDPYTFIDFIAIHGIFLRLHLEVSKLRLVLSMASPGAHLKERYWPTASYHYIYNHIYIRIYI